MQDFSCVSCYQIALELVTFLLKKIFDYIMIIYMQEFHSFFLLFLVVFTSCKGSLSRSLISFVAGVVRLFPQSLINL